MEGYSLLYPLVRKLGLKSHSTVLHAVCFKPRCQYVIRLYKYVVSAGSNLVTWQVITLAQVAWVVGTWAVA